MRPGPGRAGPVAAVAWLVTAGALVLGAWLRIPYALGNHLYQDEAQLAAIASLPPGELVSFLASHESHPPLYYLLTGAWATMFGWSDAALVALPLLVGVALIPLAFLVVRRLATPAAGAIAACLIATSPVLVRYSGMLRPYALLGVLALLAGFTLIEGLTRPRMLAGYAAIGLTMVYLHNWAWVVLAGNAVVWAWLLARRRGERQAWWGLVSVHATIAVGFLPWAGALLHQVQVASYQDSGQTLPDRLDGLNWALFGMPPEFTLVLLVGVAGFALLVRRGGPPESGPRRGAAAVLLAAPLVTTTLVFALLPVANLLVTQSFSILVPPVMAGLAVVLTPATGRKGLIGAAATVLAVLFGALWSVPAASRPKTNTHAVAAVLTGAAGAEDLVVLMSGHVAPAFHRYYAGAARVVVYPDSTLKPATPFDHRRARDADPASFDWVTAQVTRAAEDGRRLWFVWQDPPKELLTGEHARLLGHLEASYGPARCVSPPPAPRPAMERMRVSVFEVAGSGRDVGDVCGRVGEL